MLANKLQFQRQQDEIKLSELPFKEARWSNGSFITKQIDKTTKTTASGNNSDKTIIQHYQLNNNKVNSKQRQQ